MADELTVKEQLEQMINGTHENVEFEDEIDDNVAEEQEIEQEAEGEIEEPEAEVEETEDTEEYREDTDQETDTEEEEDTEQESDGSTEETSEPEEEGQEEDALDDANESEVEDTTSGEDTAEPNYKEFYEKVALAKFTANGREVEGFKDPDDLIRAQQMLHGYSDKMKVFKEYKPFLKALEERQITGDSDKFNLAMSLLDGDPEAIKTVLKDKEIDPMELDLEDIQYAPKNVVPSNAQMLIEESYEQAENLGIGDKFNKVISKDWDVQSLQEFVENGAVRNDLMQHLKDGTYDVVQDEINRMELLDSSNTLDGMSSIEKYRAAIGRLQKGAVSQVEPEVRKPADTTEADKIAEEIKAKEAAEYKRKAAEREQKVAEDRKKAASVSKKKVASKPKPKPKLEELKGDEFRNAFKSMLMS